MPGIHKYKTISFRPTDLERNIIEQKAALSGMPKKDFIAKSCIYSNVCVVGNKKNVQKIVDAVEEMMYVMKEISSVISAGDFPLSTDTFKNMSTQYLATCNAIVEILDGASYLFGHKIDKSDSDRKRDERLEQLLSLLEAVSQDEKA